MESRRVAILSQESLLSDRVIFSNGGKDRVWVRKIGKGHNNRWLSKLKRQSSDFGAQQTVGDHHPSKLPPPAEADEAKPDKRITLRPACAGSLEKLSKRQASLLGSSGSRLGPGFRLNVIGYRPNHRNEFRLICSSIKSALDSLEGHGWRRIDAELAHSDGRVDQLEEAVEGTLGCYKDVPLSMQMAILVGIAQRLAEPEPDMKDALYGMFTEVLGTPSER